MKLFFNQVIKNQLKFFMCIFLAYQLFWIVSINA